MPVSEKLYLAILAMDAYRGHIGDSHLQPRPVGRQAEGADRSVKRLGRGGGPVADEKWLSLFMSYETGAK
jgi:hypothetical protein